MKVKLIAHTNDPEKVVAAAAKLCYSGADSIDTLMDGLTEENTAKFIQHLSELGHQSPMEHASFTFAIEGVSRSLLAQITRHRIASFSVQSQRYCDMRNAEFERLYYDDDEIDRIFQDAFSDAADAYDALIERGVSKEDARYVLPEACHTRMIVTMNARELLNFFRLRCCNRAQWEIRNLANRMLSCVYAVAPNLFATAGASCVSGSCPEGKMSCGHAELVRLYTENIKNSATQDCANQ